MFFCSYYLRVSFLNIDHTQRKKSVKSSIDFKNFLYKFQECYQPDIFSLVEASGVTQWKNQFEESFNYNSYFSRSPYSYFYIAWRRDRFELIQPIISYFSRYVGVVLYDLHSKSIILYISVHLPNKDKKSWDTYARQVLETYKEKYHGHVLCIIAGDFNNKSSHISSIFSNYFSLGIESTQKTTEAGNNIDNILIDKPHDFSKIAVLSQIEHFTHYPIVADLVYYN
jgi:hypothetical protein